MKSKRIIGENGLTVDKIGTIDEHIPYLDDPNPLVAYEHSKAIGWLLLEDETMTEQEKIDKLHEIYNFPEGFLVCITKDNEWGFETTKTIDELDLSSDRFKMLIFGSKRPSVDIKEVCSGNYKIF